MGRGSWGRRRADRRRSVAAGALLLLTAAPAAAAPRFSVPAGPLDQSLRALARESGADIISIEPGLARVRARALDASAPVAEALARLLRGTPYRAVAVDARSFRVVAAPHPPPAAKPPPRPAPAPRAARAEAPASAPTDVVVTASKQRIPLLRYPGSLTYVGAGQPTLSRPTADLNEIGRDLPILQNTEFGPGRDKVFIRGIADSSFNGATQTTASTYLGDVQLNFSEQDPDLKLYDMAGVQVLEGPQGTLYGSGAIGGIIRLLPNPVDLRRTAAEVAGGVTLTQGGEPGGDASGVVNLPILSDHVGLRIVGYDEHAGGYIDDPGRGKSDVNRVDTVGGRAALRIAPGAGWTLDLGGVVQRISAADAQYADLAVGPFARRSAFAQPYRNGISVASGTIAKTWDSGLELLSVTGLSIYTSRDLFDATPLAPPGGPPGPRPGAPPTLYATDGDKELLSQETRLSRSVPGGVSWVAGFSLLRNQDSTSRALGPANMPADIIGVTNVTRSASVFGEATTPATPNLSATLGGRVTFARTDGDPSFQPRAGAYVVGRSTARFDPTVALSWRLTPDLAVFARAQSGYRTGGLAVARGVGRVANYDPDSIRVVELGVRKVRDGPTGVALSSSVSLARWTDIQADLVNRLGLPYTLTLGDARIFAVEGQAEWVPVRGLRAAASALFTDNSITGALAASSTPAHRRLPETPAFAGAAELDYEWRCGTATLSAGGTASYVGRSVLGAGDLLDISQGNYAVAGLRAGWARGRLAVTLDLDNLTDEAGNLFASGNPFALARRGLATPLRPRSVRLGTRVRW